MGKKIAFTSSEEKIASEAMGKLIDIYGNCALNKADIIVALGGDGFMLQTLKKNKKSKKFFYGINSGNYGFLMNKFSSK